MRRRLTQQLVLQQGRVIGVYQQLEVPLELIKYDQARVQAAETGPREQFPQGSNRVTALPRVRLLGPP